MFCVDRLVKSFKYCLLILPWMVFTAAPLLGLKKETSNWHFTSCNRSEKEEIFDPEQTDFSMIKSLVDPLIINEFVKENYAFDGPIDTSVLFIGINDMYLVKTKDQKYVLRLSRVEKYLTMSDSEFLFELEWLEFLNQHDVPVSYPIRRIDNHLCGLISASEGPRYATLFSYAEGTTDMGKNQAFILGKTLAQLHLASDLFETTLTRVHLDLHHLIHYPIEQIKNFLGEAYQEKYLFLDEIAEELAQKISMMELTEGSYGIVAGDIHGGNQHFDKNNQITLFDFEFCAFGYRLYDIATFRWSRGRDDDRLWDAFLNGYQSIRALNDEEIQMINIFVKARHIWWMGLLTTLPEYKHKLNNKFWDRALSFRIPNFI